MRRILIVAGLAVIMTAPLGADVTIKATNSGKVMGMNGDMQVSSATAETEARRSSAAAVANTDRAVVGLTVWMLRMVGPP